MIKTCVQVMVVAGLAAGASAQTSPLYVSSYTDNVCHVLQGGSEITTFGWQDGAIQTLVVDSSIRTVNAYGGGGRQYDLYGTASGTTYSNPGVSPMFDATTDGVQYNYFIPYTGSTLYRTNLDWTGLTSMFTVSSAGGNLGTAYDASDDTLWISDGYGAQILHYKLDGTPISSFGVQSGGEFALGLDPADGVLYTRHDGGDTALYMYSKSGSYLGSVSTAGTALGSNYVVGMDFAPGAVPAPGSLALLGLGALGASRRRR